MITLEEQIAQLGDAVDEQLAQHAAASQGSEPPPRRWVLTVAAGLLLVGGIVAVAAISGIADPDQGSNSPTMTPQQVAEERARLDARLPSATESQQAALDDGLVTVTEILDLAQEASDCSVAAGGPRIDFQWDGEGVTRTISLGSGSPDESDRLVDISDRCWDKHVGLAEIYIALQAVLPADDQLRLRQLTIECLADAGIDAPDWPATDVDIDPSIEATCDDQAKALLD